MNIIGSAEGEFGLQDGGGEQLLGGAVPDGALQECRAGARQSRLKLLAAWSAVLCARGFAIAQGVCGFGLRLGYMTGLRSDGNPPTTRLRQFAIDSRLAAPADPANGTRSDEKRRHLRSQTVHSGNCQIFYLALTIRKNAGKHKSFCARRDSLRPSAA